jgi:hypothetical protein
LHFLNLSKTSPKTLFFAQKTAAPTFYRYSNNFTGMYLKKLYKVNKWWFAVIVLFIAVQLIMDAKQGASISPVYHYGMYSAVMLPQKQYAVMEITVNGRLLQTKNFTPYQWDKITLPLSLFGTQQSWNAQVFNADIKRLLHFADSAKYVNTLSPAQFNTWYKNYLGQVLNQKIYSVTIATVPYTFNGTTLKNK